MSDRVQPSFNPVNAILQLFSSVKLGIVLLSILFIYCTIGSAGLLYPVHWNILDAASWRYTMVRQWRGLEMTEFEWFHTPAFLILIGLIIANMTVTTLRRIPLTILSAGVWTIHSGIIVLAIGSVIYFGTKVEGDAPVIRRQVVISVPGAEPVSLVALPGNGVSVRGQGGLYRFQIESTSPRWPLLTAGSEGEEVYAVFVGVTTPTEQFTRQLIAGHPEFTEDILPGRGRAKKLPGFESGLVDPSLDLRLAYQPQDKFWVRDSSALYVREVQPDGRRSPWYERPIRGLPRYNDYVGSLDLVFDSALEHPLIADPIDIQVRPKDAADPLRDQPVRIVGYLRYAIERQQIVPGGSQLNPTVQLNLSSRTASQDLQLAAFDPRQRVGLRGFVSFDWINDQSSLEAYGEAGRRLLRIGIPDKNKEIEIEVGESTVVGDEGDYTAIDGTDVSYRISRYQDQLVLADDVLSVVVVDFRIGEREFTRFVASDPSKSGDISEPASSGGHGMSTPDAAISTDYSPPIRRSQLTIVAGPENVGLHMYLGDPGETPRHERLDVGRVVELTGGVQLRVDQFLRRARFERRPAIVPPSQRERNVDINRLASMILLEVGQDGQTQRLWTPFHTYLFDEESEVDPALTMFAPRLVSTDDGRLFEVVFSRERRPLPAPVALADFILTEQVGGFETGNTLTVRDWTSILQFQTDAGWSEPMAISTNNPKPFGGYWYFQSFWDAPRRSREMGEPDHPGMNFTGLGVGNRNGVAIQLIGCCLTVIGMMYAFYVKPIIRRRRRERIHAAVAAGKYPPQTDRRDELEVTLADGDVEEASI